MFQQLLLSLEIEKSDAIWESVFSITILYLKDEEKPMALIHISDKVNSICVSEECNICKDVIESLSKAL